MHIRANVDKFNINENMNRWGIIIWDTAVIYILNRFEIGLSSIKRSYGSSSFLLSGGSSLAGNGLGSLSETVLKLSGDMFQVLHSACALSPSSDGLLRPIISSDLAAGIAVRGISLLLLVPCLLTTDSTQSVWVIVSSSEWLGSLSLHIND